MSWQVQPDISTTWEFDSGKFGLEDLLQYENTDDGWLYKIEKIDNEHFVVGYMANNSIYLKTFKYNGGLTLLDTYIDGKYTTTRNFTMALIDETHLAISFLKYDTAYDQSVYTFEFSDDYEITLIDSLKHNATSTSGGYDSMIQMDDSHIVLMTNLLSGGSRIKTFSLDVNYNITLEDTYDNGDNGSSTSMIKIDDTHFMSANETTDNKGVIRVFELDENYNISLTSSLTHDDLKSYYFAIQSMPDNKYVLIYTSGSSPDNNSLIKVFSMDNYILTQKSVTINEEDNGYNSTIVKADDEYFIAEYLVDDYGLTKAYKLNSDNTVTLVDTLNVGGDYGYITKIKPNTYALGYLDADTYVDSYINIIGFVSNEEIWESTNNVTTTWTEV